MSINSLEISHVIDKGLAVSVDNVLDVLCVGLMEDLGLGVGLEVGLVQFSTSPLSLLFQVCVFSSTSSSIIHPVLTVTSKLLPGSVVSKVDIRFSVKDSSSVTSGSSSCSLLVSSLSTITILETSVYGEFLVVKILELLSLVFLEAVMVPKIKFDSKSPRLTSISNMETSRFSIFGSTPSHDFFGDTNSVFHGQISSLDSGELTHLSNSALAGIN